MLMVLGMHPLILAEDGFRATTVRERFSPFLIIS